MQRAFSPMTTAGWGASPIRVQLRIRRRPEEMLLYQLVADLWSHFKAQMERD